MTTTEVLPAATVNVSAPSVGVAGTGMVGMVTTGKPRYASKNIAKAAAKNRANVVAEGVVPPLDSLVLPQESHASHRTISALMAHLKHTQDMIRLAEKQIAAQQARISLLEDLATTDDLTGIKNRRGFYEAFLRELECCRRGSSKGGLLVMIDLDNFKAVNDTYGHLAGDAVLKLVARTLIGEIRRTDIAARLGGDEFVLLLSNTTIGDSTARAQAIGWQMNNLSLAWDGHIIPVQASLGVKPFADGDEPEDVLSSTDGMLYAMKAERKKIPKG